MTSPSTGLLAAWPRNTVLIDETETRAVAELYDLAADQYQIHNVRRDPAYRPVVIDFKRALPDTRVCAPGSCQVLEAE